MTKVRPPMSFHQAISRVGGRLGWDKAAEAASAAGPRVAPRTAQNWSDQDTGALPTVEQALALDLAYLADGGEEPPILTVMALRLKIAMTSAPSNSIAGAASDAAKETGEAVSASIVAAMPGATRNDRQNARREAEEGIASLQAVIRTLDAADGDSS